MMKKWFRKNSLYLLLTGCIVTVALGTFTLGGLAPQPSPAKIPEIPPVEEVTVTAPPAQPVTEPIIEPVSVAMPQIVEVPVQAEPTPVPVSYALPVKGKVMREYTMDQLVYSPTMEDWRTHSGTDFLADKGTTVCAVADGIIESITYETLKGITVVISHPDGMLSTYSNLKSLDSVKKGASVKRGSAIGEIGETALFELNDPPHLHFELQKDGNPINPKDVLPILP